MDHGNPLLVQAAVYFAAAVVAVLVAQRPGLGSVAGYLLAGIAIGPWGLRVLHDRVVAPRLVRTAAQRAAETPQEGIEREAWLSALKLGEKALAAIGGDAERAARAARTFAEHDEEVLARLYDVYRNAPDSHVAVSNELRDQLAQTLGRSS